MSKSSHTRKIHSTHCKSSDFLLSKVEAADFSKSLNVLVETAVVDGLRLDEQEVPQWQKR